jgi:phosphoribosylanthranilate isomerase
VEKVGLFVDESASSVREVADRSGLTALQLHSREIPRPAVREFRAASIRQILVVCPVKALFNDKGEFEGLGFFKEPGNAIDGILFDSGDARQPGGTGRAFDWDRMAPFVDGVRGHLKVVVAGGLTPTNVARAMDTLHPWGVDVASGVEVRPGRKDPEKVKAFIAAVREADGI